MAETCLFMFIIGFLLGGILIGTWAAWILRWKEKAWQKEVWEAMGGDS